MMNIPFSLGGGGGRYYVYQCPSIILILAISFAANYICLFVHGEYIYDVKYLLMVSGVIDDKLFQEYFIIFMQVNNFH